MNFRKYFAGALVSASMLFASAPANAGVPVFDGANLAVAIENVLGWVQQAEQMISQINQMEAQFEQAKATVASLGGLRGWGNLLRSADVQAALPPAMQDATALLTNPKAALSISPAALDQILTSYGINTTNPNAGAGQAAILGQSQQILTSAQNESNEIQQLQTQVNATADAKDSLDLLNRNVLEAANISNQNTQTLAALEAARQAAVLKQIADDQQFYAGLDSAHGQPLQTYSY